MAKLRCNSCKYIRNEGLIEWIAGRGFEKCDCCKMDVCSSCVISGLSKKCTAKLEKIPTTEKNKSWSGKTEVIEARSDVSSNDAIFELKKMCLAKGGDNISGLRFERKKSYTDSSTEYRKEDIFIPAGKSTTHEHHYIYIVTGTINYPQPIDLIELEKTMKEFEALLVSVEAINKESRELREKLNAPSVAEKRCIAKNQSRPRKTRRKVR